MSINVKEEVHIQHAAGLAGTHTGLTARAPLILLGVAFIGFGARLFRLISRHAVNIFFWDQWDFNDATLFEHHSLWEIFRWQPGPQRQGLGGLLQKLIEPWFHWNSRTESFVVGGIIVVSTILVLWLKRTLYGKFSFFDVVIPIIYFTPRQYENIFVTANIARDSLPALLFVLYCLAWTMKPRVSRYVVIFFINFVAIYTGFGFFIGVLTPALLILDYHAQPEQFRPTRTSLVAAMTACLLSLGSFFLDYANRPGLNCFSWRPLLPTIYLQFVAVMFANFFAVPGTQRLAQLFGTGVLLMLISALAVCLWKLLRGRALIRAVEDWRRPLVISALISYGILFAVNAAYGRACSGLFFAPSSRYVIFLEPAILGLYFSLLAIRHFQWRTAAVTALLVAALPAAIHLDPTWFHFPDGKARWRSCYLKTEDIQRCDEMVGFKIYPVPQGTHLKQKLQFLKQTRQNLYADSN